MSNGGAEEEFVSGPMAVENEPYIPVQVKYVEAQTATILRNSRTPVLPTLEISEPQKDVSSSLEQFPPSSVEAAEVLCHSPATSPSNGSPYNPMSPNKFQYDPNLSYAEKVAHEMIMTEKIYLDNLKQIIDGFLGPVVNHPDLDVSQDNIDDLFINVEEIYNFNWVLLNDMEQCHYDPVKLAECFVVKQIGFDVYTKYCTHYPRSMEVLLEWNQREDTANFIKSQQEALGHTLPLCSFLLKPVQRILKYHLLLGNIAKHYKKSEDEEGYQIIQKALSAMTNVAKHINDMKRKHEDAVHLQEIQSVLIDYEGPNLTSFGSLVLEDTFRLHGTKTGRHLFLFEKAILITKRRSDGTFTWKATVMYSNMMLADSVFREPLTFQVIPFDDRKMCYTFVARNMETKQVWLLELKRRLLDSYAAAVPMKAKQIILGNSGEDCEKENAEPDSERTSVTSTSRKGANQQRTQPSKDNGGHTTKLNKGVENERRKIKDSEEIMEDKSRPTIDSIKSPLRRKLRVFKKRKFSKDMGKPPKRISWSSDENNEEQYMDNELPSPGGDLQDEDPRVPNGKIDEITAKKCDSELPHNVAGGENTKEGDDVVSIESLLRDGTAMVSVPGENSHSSELAKLHGTTTEEDLPVKKRKLAKDNREKCKSMPPGELAGELDEVETENRSHSLSELYEKFTEEQLLSSPDSAKDLQSKYGLVSLRENAAAIRTRRLGSYDEQAALVEGHLRRNAGVNNLTDDSVSKIVGETSVTQTMKRVSAAFSDISPAFSPEETPASSTEELTEGFTGQDDEESDDLDVFQEDQHAYWDNGEDPEKEKTENKTESQPEFVGQFEKVDENTDEAWEHIQGTEETHSVSPSNDEEEEISMNDLQSNDDRNSMLYSERSSYTDTLSDSYDDRDEDLNSSLSCFDGTYQRVFSLKRAYSEENLISKSAFNETMMDSDDGSTTGIASKSYSHFDQKHSPIMRSKSLSSSHAHRRSLPLTFRITPKKKIVIQDRLWETIKEDPEMSTHGRVSVAKDGRSARKRKKRRTGQKTTKDGKRSPKGKESETAGRKPVVCSYACLNIGDYRQKEVEKKCSHGDDVDWSSGTQQDADEDTATASLHSTSSVDTLSESSQEKATQTVTKVDVALKRRISKSKGEEDEAVVRVDKNVSEVPKSINYLCIETFPSDEPASEAEQADSGTEDSRKCNGVSKVERLSKYFDEFEPEDIKTKYKSTDVLRSAGNIKQRVEQLNQRERSHSNPSPEENSHVKEELHSMQNIKDRIDQLKRSSLEEKQATTRMKPEIHTSLVSEAPSVKRLKDRIEEIALTETPPTETNSHIDEELRTQLQTSLRIKDRIEELQQDVHDDTRAQKNGKIGRNVNDELRESRRIKDRIEKLQKGKEREVDSGRDITISDESETNETVASPRHIEELRTVVVKRGWVQQFIQKIETGS